MGFTERFDTESERASLVTRCVIPQIDENSHGLVVALGLLAGHESVDLAPQLFLAADEVVEVRLPGDRCLAIAPDLFLGSSFGLHSDALASIVPW